MNEFWKKIDLIVINSEVVIDRPKGSKHPKYSNFIYPLDYGYLKGTKSTDCAEIDVWRGSNGNQNVVAIICTVDELKRDSEMKILIGCSETEKHQILDFLNSSKSMAAILIERE